VPAAASPRRVRTVAVLVALQLAGSGTAAVLLQPGPQPATGSTSAVRAAPAEAQATRLTAVQALLRARGRAVLQRDRSAFLATVDPRRKAFREEQGDLFDALAGVPLTAWSYRVDADQVQRADRTLDARYGTWWAPQVTLLHALKGIDEDPSESPQHLTFVERADRWYIASDSDFADRGDASTRGLWDGGRVVAVSGRHSLVLGHPGSRAEMRRLARDVDAAVPRVSEVWGTGWSQRVAVLVPGSQRELGQIVHAGGDLTPIAALALAGPVRGGTAQGGDRVLVNPPNLARLSGLGRRVVLAHEVTHVAARAATGPLVPSWLAEGLADHVGYLGAGVPVRLAASELREDVLAGRLPKRLPTDADFDSDNPDLAEAYEQAWLAVELLVRRYGERRFLTLYRDLGARREGDRADALQDALQEVLGIGTARLVADWRASLPGTLS